MLFLDDDVEMSTDAIRTLFSVMRSEGLHLAQPALTADSSSHFRTLYAVAGGRSCRRVNAVEIMAPALSREALHACGAAFGVGISGYGVDILLGESVTKTFGSTVAVIDSALARHSQPVDLKDGSFYRFMVEWGIDPHVEMWILLDEYGLSREISEL